MPMHQSRDSSGLRDDFRHLIDGGMVGSSAAFEVFNPATGAAFALCPEASRAQLDAAVSAARRAFTAGGRLRLSSGER